MPRKKIAKKTKRSSATKKKAPKRKVRVASKSKSTQKKSKALGRCTVKRKGNQHYPEQTKENKQVFLENLGGQLSVMHAANQAGVARSTVYNWIRSDPKFATLVDNARESAVDELEESLYDRAVNRKNHAGVTAAIFLLKGRRSEIYHDKSHNVISGPEGGPVQIQNWLQIVESAIAAVDGGKLETKKGAKE